MGQEDLPLCKFGEKCYRKNGEHLRNFRHASSANNEHSDQNNKKPADATQKDRSKITDFFGSASSSRKRKAEVVETEVKMEASPKTKTVHTSRSPVDSPIKDVHPQSPKASISKSNADGTSPVKRRVCTLNVSKAIADDIKNYFALEIPEDFVLLWKYCCQKNSDKPWQAVLPSLGLQLIGPYDVLSGFIDRDCIKENNMQLHWRYFYDPPEFISIVAELEDGSDNHRVPCSTGFHMGYFRDDPKEKPGFVAWNYAASDGSLLPKGDNVFASLRLYGEELVRRKIYDEKRMQIIKHEINEMKSFLDREHANLSFDSVSKKMKSREKQVVTKTFHGAGLVVPVVNDIGYRPLPESSAGLKKILTRIVAAKSESEKLAAFEPLQEIVTLCQFANDEGDFGEGIELGLDLFTYGSEKLHSTIAHLLPLGYRLCGRPEYADIIELHLANRNPLSKSIDSTFHR